MCITVQCVHFCQLRKVHSDPELDLYGSLIPVVEDFKLGMEVLPTDRWSKNRSGLDWAIPSCSQSHRFDIFNTEI